MVKSLLMLVMLALMAGCQVCEKHPVACSVGAGILVYSIVASTRQSGSATTQADAFNEHECSTQPIKQGRKRGLQ